MKSRQIKRTWGTLALLPVFLLALAGGSAKAHPTSFATGSLIIPMDTTYQNMGMWKAYGLVYRLNKSGVPVRWAISQTKSWNGIDFTATTVDQRTGAVINSGNPYDYRGGPFIIDSADAAAALPIISAWWGAQANQPTVHRATAAFTADIDIVLKRAPEIAVEATNFSIASAYFTAAGIPDMNGNAWSTLSPNVMTQTSIANGGLFLNSACSPRKFDVFVTPHNSGYAYSLTDPNNLGTKTYQQLDYFVFQGGGWIALCHSILSNENAIADLYRNSTPAVRAMFASSVNSGFLTQAGFTTIANGAGTYTVPPEGARQPVGQAVPTVPAQALPGGSVQTWNRSTVSYLPGVENIAWFQNGAIINDHVINGVYHGGDGRGKMTFIGGHSFATSLPYSGNYEAPYLRFFYNALFFNGAAVANVGLETSPATIPMGNTVPVTVKLRNTGASTATFVDNLAITLEPGVTYLGMASGPTPTVSYDGGKTILTFAPLGDVPAETTALQINTTASYASVGVYKIAEVTATYGDVFAESFKTKDCRDITVTPAPVPAITKTPPTQGPVLSGDHAEWTLTYANNGPASLLNAVVEDILPAGFSIDTELTTPLPTSSTSLPDGSLRLRWSVGTINSGGSGTITLVAHTPRITGGNEIFTNSVKLSGTESGGSTLTSPTATATVEVTKPAMDLNKTVNLAEANPGNTLTYTITPTYNDVWPLNNVVITDIVPTYTTYVANSANAGGTYDLGTNTITWLLGSNDPPVPAETAGPGTAYCPAPGSPLVLNTDATVVDTYIDIDRPTTNYGALTEIFTRPANATWLKYGLIRFDLSSLPAGAVIQSAIMTMTVSANRGKHIDKVYEMVTPWTEAGATWNTRNGSTPWAGGGAFSAADYNPALLLGSISVKVKDKPLNVDITESVKAWFAGTRANNGLALIATGTDAADAKYYSSENTNTARRPMLSIRYLLSTPATPGTIACSNTASVLNSIADTYVAKGAATTNYGTLATTYTNPGTNNTTNNTKHSLIKFDLGAIPPGAVINSATLQVYTTAARATAHVDNVYRMVSAWDESTATWNTRNGSTAWAGGGVFGTADFGATLIGSITPSAVGAKTLDVTSLVNDWVNNGVPNRGIVLYSTGSDNGDAQYGTRENTTPANRPIITVNWALYASGAPATKTELSASPGLLGGTGTVTVTMKASVLGSSSPEVSITPPASLTVSAGSATVTQTGGPNPASAVVPDGGGFATFTYTYTISPASVPVDVTFSGAPTGTFSGGNVPFVSGTSNSVISTPALTFQATVNSPLALSVNQVANYVNLTDDAAFADGLQSPAAITKILQPLLTLTKSVSPTGTFRPGETLTYTLTLTNDGTGPATNVVVNDPIPTNTTYVSCTGGGSCGPVSGNVRWNIASLAAQSSVTLTFTVSGNTGLPVGSYTVNNTASVTSTEITTPVSSNTTTNTLLVEPKLTIVKSQTSNSPDEADSIVHPGNTITYTLLITNTGTSPVTTISGSDPVPAGITYVPGSVTAVLENPAGSATSSYSAGTVYYSVASLAVNQRIRVTFQATVDDPNIDELLVQNRTSLTATGYPEPQYSNYTSYVVDAAPIINVTKSSNPPSGTVLRPNDYITYTLTVWNSGNALTDSAYVQDYIPVGTTYVPNSITINGVSYPDVSTTPRIEEGLAVFTPGYGDEDGVGGVLLVGVGNACTVTFQVQVDDVTPTITPISNFATALTTTTPPVTSNTTTNPVNDAPDAVNDDVSTPEDTAVLGNVSTNDNPSNDGGNVWSVVTPPAHGNLVFNPDGTFTYTPYANYCGLDSFTYQICDGSTPQDCDTAYVFITVACVDDFPVANDDSNSTDEDTPVSGSVAGNDTESGDGGNVWSLVGENGGAAHGTVTMDDSGNYTYTPDPDYNGTDTFTYQVCDVDGDCDTATVTVTINPVPDGEVTIVDCAPDITVQCLTDVPPVDVTQVNASTTCEINSMVTVTHVGDETSEDGCITYIRRTYRATDACGNTADCVQTIRVEDTLAPSLHGVPDDLTVQCTDGCDSILLFGPDITKRIYQHLLVADPALAAKTDLVLTGPRYDPNALAKALDAKIARDGKPYCTMLFDPEYAGPDGKIYGGLSESDQARLKQAMLDGMGFVYAEPGNPKTWDGSSWVEKAPLGQIPNVIPLHPEFSCDHTQQYVIIDQTSPLAEGMPSIFAAASSCQNTDITLMNPVPGVAYSNVRSVGYSLGMPWVPGQGGDVIWTLDFGTNGSRVAIIGTDPYPDNIQDNDMEAILRLYYNAIKYTARATGATIADHVPAPPVVVALDNCAGQVPVTFEETITGQCPSVITRTWTAVDECGNQVSDSQQITVYDTAPPVLVCPPNITVPNETGTCGATVIFGLSAYDACGAATVESFPASGSVFPVGDTVVLVRATDACGNQSTCTFKVTVTNTNPGCSQMTNATNALKIADGILTATSGDMSLLNVVESETSPIDIRDAARLARKAVGLDP